MDRGTAIVLTLAVGAGFALQSPINSALGRDIGPIPAATVSFAAGTVILIVVSLLFGGGFGASATIRSGGTTSPAACSAPPWSR